MRSLIQREMLRASRDAMFHASRWVAALGSVGLLWGLARTMAGPLGELGLMMARGFHGVLCVALLAAGAWIGAPVLLRERSEGTLPLLFLTPLTPSAIVLGKAMGAVLRFLALWLATVPAGMVPIVFGAVAWWDAVTFVSLEAAMGATGLAAGLMASATVRRPGELVRTTVSLTLVAGTLVGGTLLGFLGLMRSPPAWAWPVLGTFCAMGVTGVALIFGLPMVAAVLRAEMSGDNKDGGARRAFADEEDVELVEERVWRRHWSRGDGAKVRGRNPLRWLQLRDPGRLPSWWIWVGVVVIGWASSVAMDRRTPPLDGGRRWVVELAGWAMLAAMGIRASRGYRREVESGAMELLLPTGLKDGAFLGREPRALMAAFWQPLAVHGLMAWIAWRTTQPWVWPERMAWVFVAPWWAGWTGLWMSGALRGPWSAAAGTVVALGIPWGVAWAVEDELGLGRAWGSWSWALTLAALMFGIRWHLGGRWRTREFVAGQLRAGDAA